jgi:hypothetical protein
MKVRVIQFSISLLIGIASFWLVVEGGIIGVALIPLILIGLSIPASRRVLRIGTYLSGLGLTGAGLMGTSLLTTVQCPHDGSAPVGGCVEGGDPLIVAFAGIGSVGLALLLVAALKQRKGIAAEVSREVSID